MQYIEIYNTNANSTSYFVTEWVQFHNGVKKLVKTTDIVKTVRNAPDGDWKTQLAKGYPDIPAGTELSICGFVNNFYGRWVDVKYKGHRYSISPNDLEFVKCVGGEEF